MKKERLAVDFSHSSASATSLLCMFLVVHSMLGKKLMTTATSNSIALIF